MPKHGGFSIEVVLWKNPGIALLKGRYIIAPSSKMHRFSNIA
jgi:hypothetical protein